MMHIYDFTKIKDMNEMIFSQVKEQIHYMLTTYDMHYNYDFTYEEDNATIEKAYKEAIERIDNDKEEIEDYSFSDRYTYILRNCIRLIKSYAYFTYMTTFYKDEIRANYINK